MGTPADEGIRAAKCEAQIRFHADRIRQALRTLDAWQAGLVNREPRWDVAGTAGYVAEQIEDLVAFVNVPPAPTNWRRCAALDGAYQCRLEAGHLGPCCGKPDCEGNHVGGQAVPAPIRCPAETAGGRMCERPFGHPGVHVGKQ